MMVIMDAPTLSPREVGCTGSWSGIRHHSHASAPAPQLQRLLDAEYQASRRDAYRQLGSQVHLIVEPLAATITGDRPIAAKIICCSVTGTSTDDGFALCGPLTTKLTGVTTTGSATGDRFMTGDHC